MPPELVFFGWLATLVFAHDVARRVYPRDTAANKARVDRLESELRAMRMDVVAIAADTEQAVQAAREAKQHQIIKGLRK